MTLTEALAAAPSRFGVRRVYGEHCGGKTFFIATYKDGGASFVGFKLDRRHPFSATKRWYTKEEPADVDWNPIDVDERRARKGERSRRRSLPEHGGPFRR